MGSQVRYPYGLSSPLAYGEGEPTPNDIGTHLWTPLPAQSPPLHCCLYPQLIGRKIDIHLSLALNRGKRDTHLLAYLCDWYRQSLQPMSRFGTGDVLYLLPSCPETQSMGSYPLSHLVVRSDQRHLPAVMIRATPTFGGGARLWAETRWTSSDVSSVSRSDGW